MDWAYFTDDIKGRLEGEIVSDMYQVPFPEYLYKKLNMRIK